MERAAWARRATSPDPRPPLPTDAARVLAQKEHMLQGARLSLRPAPPWAPARLLLQGLPPGTAPERLEQHVQALLRAAGHPEQPCRALASPRPDRALVQLPKPLSEAGERRDRAGVPVGGDALSQLAPSPQKSVCWRSRLGPWTWRGPRSPWLRYPKPERCAWWGAPPLWTFCCCSCTWRMSAAAVGARWWACAACQDPWAPWSPSSSGRVSGARHIRPPRSALRPLTGLPSLSFPSSGRAGAAAGPPATGLGAEPGPSLRRPRARGACCGRPWRAPLSQVGAWGR